MYFSLIAPQEGSERDAAYDRVGAPYADHQWLWQLFPAPPGTTRDFLFRRMDAGGLPKYYVVSKRAPAVSTGAWVVRTRPYAPRLAAGDRLSFELRANPVVTSSTDGRRSRHDVVMQRKKLLLRERGHSRWNDWVGSDKPALYDLVRNTCGEWLELRAGGRGFSIDSSSLNVAGYEQHREAGQLTFSSVDFTGTLTVLDPEIFATTLFEGIGHAKAFGCGLLLVRPL